MDSFNVLLPHIIRLDPHPLQYCDGARAEERSTKLQKTERLYDIMRPHLENLSDSDTEPALKDLYRARSNIGQILFEGEKSLFDDYDDNISHFGIDGCSSVYPPSYEDALGMPSATTEHPIYMRSQIESNQNAGFGGSRPDFWYHPL